MSCKGDPITNVNYGEAKNLVSNLDIPELKEIIRLLSITSNNVNQMARQLHSTGRIYQQDIGEVEAQLEQNYKMLRKLITKHSKTH